MSAAELAVKGRDCELGVRGLIPAQLLIYLGKTLYFSDLKNKVALLHAETQSMKLCKWL